MELILGVDLGLKNVGLVQLKGDEVLFDRLFQFAIEKEEKGFEVSWKRIYGIMEELEGERLLNSELIVMERPFVSPNMRYVLDIAALYTVLCFVLYERGIDMLVVSPTALKKFVTKKGTSKKDKMMLEVYKRWRVEFADEHITDAYALARYGQAFSAEEVELSGVFIPGRRDGMSSLLRFETNAQS